MSHRLTQLDLAEARAVVARAMPSTPQFAWPLLSRRLGAEIWVKHENHTPVGAFKVRGGLVYVDRLLRERGRVAGLISATSGNHGQSIAFAGRMAGLPVTLVVPRGNSLEKNASMRALGAELIEHGEDFEAATLKARALAEEGGLDRVPSFHPNLVAGVATYAWELLTAAPDLDVLYVPIGLGSGICGCIAVRDVLGVKARIVGVQAAGAAPYARSLEAGRLITLPKAVTRADGIAVRDPDPLALEIIRAGAEGIVEVHDDEIAVAIMALWQDTHNLAEGAGAAALAAAMKERERNAGQKVAVILSGGNIDLSTFADWVSAPRGVSSEP